MQTLESFFFNYAFNAFYEALIIFLSRQGNQFHFPICDFVTQGGTAQPPRFGDRSEPSRSQKYQGRR